MEFIKFLFSSIWTFTGFVLLVLIVAAVIICIVREVKKRPPEVIDREKAYAELLRAKARATKETLCFGELEESGGDCQ